MSILFDIVPKHCSAPRSGCHFERLSAASFAAFTFQRSDPYHKNAVCGKKIRFSTHYAEILDEFERNDSIYIVRNRNGITAENLSTILKRNDIKKSEAYESGFLEGTVPMYDAYMELKKSIIRSRKKD